MSLPDFDDPAWNARRVTLEKAVDDAIQSLVVHMGGGMLVEFPLVVNGITYTLRMERTGHDSCRRMN